MKTATSKNKVFNTKKSIAKASKIRSSQPQWRLDYGSQNYVWNSKMDRVDLVREGISYGALEVVGKRMNTPISQMLKMVDMPQTTYNKKKKRKTLFWTAATVN